MKRLLCLFISLTLLAIPFSVTLGETPTQSSGGSSSGGGSGGGGSGGGGSSHTSSNAVKLITLRPGWNVVSTPAILSSIEFSNEGEGISFSKLSNGKWISAPANTTNIKPLEGFMVYNSNSDNVTMTLRYKTDVSPMQSLFTKDLNYGWDFVGITTTKSPFNNIGPAAVMSVDFTNNGSINYLNKVVVGGNYAINTTSSSIEEPQLGEAYGIFVNQQNAIYGGANNIEDDSSDPDNPGGGDDCEDSTIVNACSSNSDTCPTNCRVSIDYKNHPNENIIAQGVSDGDEISVIIPFGGIVNDITLQKYGYATVDSIDQIRLEDEYGNIIADSKSLDVNGKATLQIKNDYKKTTKNFKAVVVIQTNSSFLGGQTNMLGFKVINTDVNNYEYSFNDNYEPYLYSSINYAGYLVQITPNGTNMNYNRADDTYYEVSKFKVIGGDADMIMKGFVLSSSGNLDLENEETDISVELTNGGELKNLNAWINKDDELVVNFDDLEIPSNASVTFVVKIKISDFDQQGKSLQYTIKSVSDLRIREKSTGVRACVNINEGNRGTYTFEGGKIKFTNVALGNIEASQGSTDIKIAEGNIEITEPVTMSFDITASDTGIDMMRLKVGSYEYNAKRTIVDSNVIFQFNNVYVKKSGLIQFYVDIAGDAETNSSVTFTNLSKNVITAKYNNSNIAVDSNNIAGSISFSRVTFMTPKGSLSNNLTKASEFIQNELGTRDVFDGIYGAKKGDIYLNEFSISGTKNSDGNDIIFHLFIDGHEVTDINNLGSDTFADVKINAGESVSVKVIAEIDARTIINYSDFELTLKGEDANGNLAGVATANLVTIKVVDAPFPTISTTTNENNVLLKDDNTTIAEFNIKPSNTNGDLLIDSIKFTITPSSIKSDDVRVYVDNQEISADDDALEYDNLDISADAEGVMVRVKLRNEIAGDVTISLNSINDVAFNRMFTTRFVEALVYVSAVTKNGDITKFTIGVDKPNNIEVSNFKIYADSNYNLVGQINEFENGDYLSSVNDEYAHSITKVSYDITNGGVTQTIEILKSDFPDYFMVGDDDIIVYSNK